MVSPNVRRIRRSPCAILRMVRYVLRMEAYHRENGD